MPVITVTGYVQDAVSGNPVAGAVVNVYAHNDVNAAGALLGTDAATDANGKFEIASITHQQIDLQITNAGQVYWAKGLQSGSFGDLFINSLTIDPTSVIQSSVPVLLSRATITANVTTAPSFATIIQTFKHLKLVGQVRWGSGSTLTNQLSFRLNSDSTAAHYVIQDSQTSPAATGSSGRLGLAPPVGATGNNSLAFEAMIYNYTDTNLYKIVNVVSSADTGNSGLLGVEVCANVWKSTAAITQIDVSDFASSYVWAAGSNLELWGIP